MDLVQEATVCAKKAVNFDESNNITAARYYYNTAATLLSTAAAQLSSTHTNDESKTGLLAKASEYRERADILETAQTNPNNPDRTVHVEDEENRKIIQQCYFLLQEAIEEDEGGTGGQDVVELYAKAVDFIRQSPDLLEQSELKQLCMQALERAETLKKCEQNTLQKSTPTVPTTSYTTDEKAVLLHTSRINNRDYVPFMSIDLQERFQYSIPFTDPDGKLTLSPKQKQSFAAWVRPTDLSTQPCIVADGGVPNYLAIKQTVVSDCSLVASLAVAASYVRRFGRSLVTAILYPQARHVQKPRYNPFGKYMVRLHVNGISRKVIIDDQLPTDRYGRLLCSYSANRDEFWVSLVEKAYMKVMGGYDFPGSNSNIDLHALTGWIPERIQIRSDFNRDALFATLETRMANGDVLVTLATGEMSDSVADRCGLVPLHAYALMCVKTTATGVRLLKLKNPWSHLRWRGNYSELDTKHWTTDLQKTLKYDPNSAAQFDNGVFWIDYDSVCAFFDVFYMNWNPDLFPHTYCIHQQWNAGTGPIKDLYTIGANPQYRLNVDGTTGAVWLLLTRHIVEIEDFRENQEYITLLVYNKSGGKRVYYPFDPPPYIDGIKINSPHYLCKIILNSSGGGSSRNYTVVVSQYEKSTTIYYTLRAYATCPITLEPIKDEYVKKEEVTGEWKGRSAGGCPNHPATFRFNPIFHLEHNQNSSVNMLIELRGPKQYQLGIEVTIVKVNDPEITAPFRTISSGSYRSGYVVMELEKIPAGILQIIPATYLPGQEGPFILCVKSGSATNIQLSRI